MSRSRRARIARVAMALFLLVVAWLLVRYARSVDWPQVMQALRSYGVATLAGAAAFTALSYLLFCSYDLGARRYSGHALSTPRVAAIAFVSYAMSLNLGAMIGGGGMRLRLYSHAGLRPLAIGRIVAFSVFTNWLGYTTLAGLLFATGAVSLPPQWPVRMDELRWIGVLMVAASVAYLVACAIHHGRQWTVRGHVFELPTLPLALLQLLVSCANWLVIAGVLYLLLHRAVPYPTVLGVLLLASIAAAMVHVPAGLGVLEAVFLAMLRHRLGEAPILAALLAYRAVYYLVPLGLGVVIYAVLEAHFRAERHARVEHRMRASPHE